MVEVAQSAGHPVDLPPAEARRRSPAGITGYALFGAAAVLAVALSFSKPTLGIICSLTLTLVAVVLAARARARIATHLTVEHTARQAAETAQAHAEAAQARAQEAQARAESMKRDLDVYAQELARSNAELEQFAYVASHDLQEPLRMVSSYVQLLKRRYAGQLDADADKYIAYASDGATRMQRLINDLLVFSRVGTRARDQAPVALEDVLAVSLEDLRTTIAEAGAVITHDPLPDVLGDGRQLGQLFQNVIGNAIKFRGDAAPRVHLSAQRRGEVVEVAIRDNGIGIEPQFFDRIFIIFQRLHGPGKYPGTGIGLALCKKIVERHGGRMWVTSEAGQGTTFRFTLPAADGQPQTTQGATKTA